jgi:hypothetical protein
MIGTVAGNRDIKGLHYSTRMRLSFRVDAGNENIGSLVDFVIAKHQTGMREGRKSNSFSCLPAFLIVLN